MTIFLPHAVQRRLASALAKAGNREIGGVLMGEDMGEASYRIVDFTKQPAEGTAASFIRSVTDCLAPLRKFFHKHDHDYRRFDYLGEWYSHPLFIPRPSSTDIETMRGIVSDPEVGATFVVLLIIRLDSTGRLEGSATVFLPHGRWFEGEAVFEN